MAPRHGFTSEKTTGPNWFGTLNNWTEPERYALESLDCKYKVVGIEVGEEGTPHLQFQICFKKTHRLSAVKKMSPRAHWELTRNVTAAIDYCKKDEKFYEDGTAPMKPKEKGAMEQQRWIDLLEEARETGEVSDAKVQFQHGKMVDWHFKQQRRKRSYPPLPKGKNHIWYWGATGCGKSHIVNSIEGVFRKTRDDYWGDYNDEDVVAIEEFGIEDRSLNSKMKEWCDRWEFVGNTKHEHARKMRPKKIIVTSNYHPEQLWFTKEELDPILRKFKVIELKQRNRTREEIEEEERDNTGT